MNTEALLTLTKAALDDLKAMDITTIDVREITTITDIMIICSGRSKRHVKSIAENIVTQAKHQRVSYIRSEGEKESEWIIVDLADVIVHVMQPAVREFYNLEDLWAPIEVLRDAHTSAGHR